MAEAKKAAAKQVMDVARPGKSAPSPTTKPVIVTNRPVLQDPMVVKDDTDDSTPETTTPASPKRSSGLVLQPLSASKITVTDGSDDDAQAESGKKSDKAEDKEDTFLMPTIADSIPDEAEPAEPEAKPEPKAKPAKDKAEDEPTTETDEAPTDTDTEAEPDAPEADTAMEPESKTETAEEKPTDPTDATDAKPAKPTQASKPEHVTAGSVASRGTAVPTTDGALLNEDEAEREEDQHDVMIQKLVDAKTYYLPVNSVEKRRTKRVIVAGVVLSLVLAMAWADVALDAGLINISGVKPVTHFFSK